ncbi:MAG: radical SAM protein [Patescibacteria group bacterium]
MKKRVLFLQFTIGTLDRGYWNPLGLAPHDYFYAEPGVAWVAQAIAADHEVQVIDCDFLNDEEVLSSIAQFGPNIVGFSCFTAGYPRAQRITWLINSAIVKLWGGWHASMISAQVLAENPNSIVVKGRGEGVIRDIVNSPRHYTGTIIDGNAIPAPRHYPFSVVTRTPYFKFFGVPPEQKTASVVICGGCTLGCSYCPSARSGLGFMRSPEDIIHEVIQLEERGVNFIFVRDENPFLLKFRPWLLRFCDLAERTIRGRVQFHSFGDARFVDTELVQALAGAGWSGLDIGIEHITAAGRKRLGRKQDWWKTVEAFEMMKNKGLFLTANFIVWAPGDTLKTFNQTLLGLKELRPDELLPLFFTPLPGLADGKFDSLPRRTQRLEDFHFLKPILVNDAQVTDEELIVQRKLLMRNYYSSSEYIALMKFRRRQFGDQRFKNLTAIRRQRFLKYGIDLWNL